MVHLAMVRDRSVRDFASRWKAQRRELHILVNNAGIYAMGGEWGAQMKVARCTLYVWIEEPVVWQYRSYYLLMQYASPGLILVGDMESVIWG